MVYCLNSLIDMSNLTFINQIIISYYSFMILVAYLHPRYLPYEKVLYPILLLFLFLATLIKPNIKISKLLLVIFFFILAYVSLGLTYDNSYRNIAADITLYSLPIFSYYYVSSNEQLISYFEDNFLKILFFTIICSIISLISSSIFSFDRTEAIPILLISSIPFMLNYRKIGNGLKMLLIFMLLSYIVLSNVRSSILFLMIAFIFYVLKYKSLLFIVFSSVLFVISIQTFAFIADFLPESSRLSNTSLVNIFDVNSLIDGREFSGLIRYLEAEKVLSIMLDSNYFIFLFGNGFGSQLPLGNDIQFITLLADASYFNIVTDGATHHIHIGIFRIFYRFGFIGLLIYLGLFCYLIYYYFRSNTDLIRDFLLISMIIFYIYDQFSIPCKMYSLL